MEERGSSRHKCMAPQRKRAPNLYRVHYVISHALDGHVGTCTYKFLLVQYGVPEPGESWKGREGICAPDLVRYIFLIKFLLRRSRSKVLPR
jgi:hypothetical protein